VGLSANEAEEVAELVPLALDRLAHRHLVSDLVDALFQGQKQAKIERLAGRIAASAWPDVLKPAFERGLDAREDELREQLGLLARARDELAKPVRATKLPSAVVAQLAYDLADEMTEAFGVLDEIEDELEDEELPEDERRAVILRLPGKVSGAAELSTEEGDRLADRLRELTRASLEDPAGARAAVDALEADLGAVATDERRAAVREALGQLADGTRETHPFVSAAAAELAAEPTPDDPGDDEVWKAAMNALAAEVLVDRLR
jgi:hypothetical protein